jgi:hypothetical protein
MKHINTARLSYSELLIWRQMVRMEITVLWKAEVTERQSTYPFIVISE